MPDTIYRTKKELDQDYSVFGWFYNIVTGQDKGKYRSVLEIHRKSVYPSLKPYFLNKINIDLLAIMMNPGGSTPKEEQDIYEINSFADLPNSYRIHKLSHANPDDTQYQLMRIMDEFKSINSLRVVNLTDIRESESNKLKKILTKTKRHSLFSGLRNQEFKIIIPSSVPVLLAYGGVTKLKDLAKNVKALMENRDVIGVTEENKEFYYQHPLRRFKSRKEWVDKIINKINTLKLFK